jgi:hypothetical protein
MFTHSIRDWAGRHRLLTGLTCAVLYLLLSGTSARAQFDPSNLDPFNRQGDVGKVVNDPGKALAQLDPTNALRELAEARKNAMNDLRKLDPQEIFNRTEQALETRISRELRKSGVKYNAASGEIDLRGTEMGKILTHWLKEFAQGNKRDGGVEELSFNIKTKLLVVRLMAKHCQSWGKIIPGQGEVELYSVTQRAVFRYNFHTGSGDFDIDFGPLAPHLNSRTLEKLQEGDLVCVVEGLVPEAAGKLWNHEEKNDYALLKGQFEKRYGAAKVYFASRKFVDWAGPETIGKYVIDGVISGGTAVYPVIMQDVEKRAKAELPGLTDWLKRRGMANAESAARQLLSGQTPRWPYLKFEMIPVRYSSREKPLHAVTTPWRNVDHLAFVIVWTDGGPAGSQTNSHPIQTAGTGASSAKPIKPMAKTIHVRFHNQTAETLIFRLNGIKAEYIVLQPGHTRNCQVVPSVEKGPSVTFNKDQHHAATSPLHDGGVYRFRMVAGKVRLQGS